MTTLGLPGGYGALTTTVPWTDSSGGPIQQVVVASDESAAWSRYSTGTSTWSVWVNYVGTLNSNVGALQGQYASLSSTVSTRSSGEANVFGTSDSSSESLGLTVRASRSGCVVPQCRLMLRPAGGLAPGGSWRDDGISWTTATSSYALAAAALGDAMAADERVVVVGEE